MSEPAAGLRIERLRPPRIEAMLDHEERYDAQSGTRGDLPHGPREAGETRPRADRRDALRSGLRRAVGAPDWGRTWVAVDGAGAVRGHASLRWVPPSGAPHRAWCSLGLERRWRGRGEGRRLLRAAIAWAESRTELAWIDLGVFAENAPAIALYASEGFVEVGRVPDRFRVGGRSIEDVLMARPVAGGAADGTADGTADRSADGTAGGPVGVDADVDVDTDTD